MRRLKNAVRAGLLRIGWELKRLNAPATLPSWITDAEPRSLEDEEIEDGWLHNVLCMSNRHYSPRRMAYFRGLYGEDSRLKYMLYFLDLRELRVLELGPLEGHHSVLIEKMGARENIAIESRQDNYEKCLRIKAKYGLTTKFLNRNIEDMYSDKVPSPEGPFDLVFCLGVLYHMPDPARALQWMRRMSDTLFLGTHYVEPSFARGKLEKASYSFNGQTYEGAWHYEGGIADPISGMSPRSFMPNEVDLFRMLADAGFSRRHKLGKDLQNGSPHLTILAEA